jgi:hypothetical protein
MKLCYSSKNLSAIRGLHIEPTLLVRLFNLEVTDLNSAMESTNILKTTLS